MRKGNLQQALIDLAGGKFVGLRHEVGHGAVLQGGGNVSSGGSVRQGVLTLALLVFYIVLIGGAAAMAALTAWSRTGLSFCTPMAEPATS